MTAEEFNRIKGLFDAACLLSGPGREEFLKRECEQNPALLETVARLLRTYDESSVPITANDSLGPAFSPGQEIAGRFLVIRFIAKGGMGEVYEVLDKKLSARLALKTLPVDAASRPADVERFKRGILTARELPGSGICRMFDLVEHRQTAETGEEVVIPCVTMQLLEGETLSATLRRTRPLPVEEALRIAEGIAEALEIMHEREIVHRDLKPSNVMMVPVEGGPPKPVIIDFGLARRWEHLEGSATKTGPQPGAPYFVAPEVISGQKAGIAADIYSFGLVLDAMVTASDAYPWESEVELYWRKLNRDPVKPSKRAPGLPAIWDACILACLQRSPGKRPASVKRVVAALKKGDARLLEDKRVLAQVVSRRAAVGLGLGAAAGAGAFGIFSSQAPQDLNTSLIVFPFRNLTGRAGLDQLAAGSHEELVRRLRYLPKLGVFPVPANWSPDKADLGKARFSLSGSIEASSGAPLFRFRMDDNASGKMVGDWSATAPLSDPVAVQTELSQRAIDVLADSVNRQLLARALPRGWRVRAELPTPASPSAAALAAYQEGRNRALARTPEAAMAAIACYERAIGLDPNFALAYAALADVQQVLLTHNTDSTASLLDRAREFADRAVALGPQIAECHVSRGGALQGLWKWAESERSYKTALQMNPRHPQAHSWYGGLLLQFGRSEEALAAGRRGLELDPFDRAGMSTFGFYLWLAGRAADSYQHLSQMLTKADEFYPRANLGLAAAWLAHETSEPQATEYYLTATKQAAALATVETAMAGGADPGYLKWSDCVFTQAHAARRDTNAARHYAARLQRGYEAGKIPATMMAMMYSVLGERTRALEMLQLGLPLKERELLYIRVHPLFRNLRGDQKFDRIVKAVQEGA